jgi:hypothetical protein
MTTAEADERGAPGQRPLLTFAELQVLRKAGYAKPPGVPWSHWLGLKKLQGKHQVIAYMVSQGIDSRLIAKELNYTEGRLSLIINSPHMQIRIAELNEQRYGKSATERFATMLDKSLKVYEKIIDNAVKADEPTKLHEAVASKIIDRNVGKVADRVEVKNETIRAVYVLLDNINAGKNADAFKRLSELPVVDAEISSTPAPTLVDPNPSPRARDEYSEIDEQINKLISGAATGIGTKGQNA